MADFKEGLLSGISNSISGKFAYICFASFEKRCLAVAKSLPHDQVVKAYIVRNCESEMAKYNENNYSALNRLFKGKLSNIDVNLREPILIAEAMFQLIDEIIYSNTKRIVIDITTFTHEALLILINAVYLNRNCFDAVFVVYNGAAKYASWLSKGCKEVRNVIGYPGIIRPAEKDHLIILTGYEQERATKLVELIEPDFISLGNGIDPVDCHHNTTMKKWRNKFAKWSKNFQGANIESFDFSCSDIGNTVKTLNSIIDNNPSHNFILVPLNTKLSTISAALVALNNKNIQICYPIPETYNMRYSTAGDNYSMVNLLRLFMYYINLTDLDNMASMP